MQRIKKKQEGAKTFTAYASKHSDVDNSYFSTYTFNIKNVYLF